MATTSSGKYGFFDADFAKAFAGFTFPSFDIDSLAAAQRKNLEALTQANQLAVEGARAFARRQVEVARQALEEASSALREWTQPAAPDERLAKNVELAKQAYDKCMANARELTELVAKANTEAFNVLHKRVAEGFEEMRDYAKQRVGR